ncbi:hypothetical protein J7J62_04330 [bacterium]|nr:hypothetical protein [bacterium]
MMLFKDINNRLIRLTDERKRHIEVDHPEMSGQIAKIGDTLLNPDIIVKSNVDPEVNLYYKFYPVTPVSEKYLCVVVKMRIDDIFIITAYFTNKVKRGEILWERK